MVPTSILWFIIVLIIFSTDGDGQETMQIALKLIHCFLQDFECLYII